MLLDNVAKQCLSSAYSIGLRDIVIFILVPCCVVPWMYAKKAYTAAAHFGKTNFGRKAGEIREGPKPGSKNSAWGRAPIFWDL